MSVLVHIAYSIITSESKSNSRSQFLKSIPMNFGFPFSCDPLLHIAHLNRVTHFMNWMAFTWKISKSAFLCERNYCEALCDFERRERERER